MTLPVYHLQQHGVKISPPKEEASAMAASNILAQACLTLGGCSRRGICCEGPVELDAALQLQAVRDVS